MVKGIGFKGKLHLAGDLQKGLIIKIVLVLVLAVIAVLLFAANKDLLKENRKMIKYIKNQEAYQRDLKLLRTSENQLEKYFVKIGENATDADLEKIKSGYIDNLLDIIKKNDLQVDSYRSEIEKSEDFVIFKYNITIVGEFIRVIRFFHRLLDQAKYMYVYSYDIRLHIKTDIRLGLTVHIIGVK
jgi:hypothetical protein